jgi:hypothetical protein
MSHRLPHMRMPRWQRRQLLLAALMLGLSGVVWLVVHYGWGAGTGELPHPAEPWLMRLHGLGVFLGLFAVGVVAGAHVPHGWRWVHHHRAWRQRRDGVALCLALALIAATGYALYYLVNDEWRPFWGWLHSGLGLMILALGWRHAWHRLR